MRIADFRLRIGRRRREIGNPGFANRDLDRSVR
jgi:hypothetical protein